MKSARNYFSFFPRLLTLWVFLSLTLQGFAAVPLCFAETLANPLPDTGQTTFYDNSGVISEPAPGEPFYGQDASYLRARSYTKLDQYGNDLPFSASQWYQVRDNVTGLIWEVKNSRNGSADYGNPNDADNTYTWYDSNPATNGGYAGTPGAGTDTEDFINALNNASYGGHNDWRLPTVAELSLLTDLGTFDPAISADYFPQTVSSYYWSSTTYAGSTDVAWLVHFYDGYVRYDGKSYSYYVRAVRSGQPRSLDPLIINQNDPAIPEDDTVTDPNTGLMWQRYEGGEMAWSEALDYCQNLTLAGYDDWRLPDRHELQSLIDYARFGPALDESVFPEVVSSYYWSSTTNAFNTGYAWRVYFYNGYVRNISKSSSYYVRAVRSGQSGPLGHSAISVTPTSLDFGTAAVGADLVVRSVTVQNLGAADLILGSASITGPDAGVFALATDYDGYVLAPQAATPVEIAVAWLPIAGAADPSAQLNISSNDPVNPLVTVPLIGHLAGELSLNTVLDNYDLVFTTGGTGSWFGQTETAAYGGSAAQSMNINDDQASWVETEITGPATLTFLWRVSSEENYDFFECLLDGSPGLKMRISGDVAWQERTLAIPAGSHTVRWLYTKDYSVSSGADAAWLDRVRVEAGCQQTFYRDSDNDGYGDLYVSVAACATPTGYVVNSLDCNDNDADEHPDQIWYRDYD
ncbi:MAG: DUF1566 domain-containing protein, partial [Deltaproteobacteria bacterium]|nr:DUF1566 domain-containing protein [Deltaproteobacteria bacterium]